VGTSTLAVLDIHSNWLLDKQGFRAKNAIINAINETAQVIPHFPSGHFFQTTRAFYYRQRALDGVFFNFVEGSLPHAITLEIPLWTITAHVLTRLDLSPRNFRLTQLASQQCSVAIFFQVLIELFERNFGLLTQFALNVPPHALDSMLMSFFPCYVFFECPAAAPFTTCNMSL